MNTNKKTLAPSSPRACAAALDERVVETGGAAADQSAELRVPGREKPVGSTGLPVASTKGEGRPILERQIFTTSRLLDYFSEKELMLQTGHDREHWPEVALKELVDNALDAAEDSGTAPEVSVTVEDNTLTVADNGPGIAPDVVTRILNFSTKTSSKDFYVSPTRGAQGNALKTLIAMPHVLSGGAGGQLEISSQGVRHVINVAVDRIRQEPIPDDDPKPCDVKNGSVVKIHWPELARLRRAGTRQQFFTTAEVLRPVEPARDLPFPRRYNPRERASHGTGLAKVAAQ